MSSDPHSVSPCPASPGSSALSTSAPDTMSRCPLCQQANQCAMEIEKATGIPQPPCWCVSATFPKSLLDQLPADARSCICPTCAQAHGQG